MHVKHVREKAYLHQQQMNTSSEEGCPNFQENIQKNSALEWNFLLI